MLKNQLFISNVILIFAIIAFLAVYHSVFIKNLKDANVILIAFDGLQAKHLSAYGYPLKTTPNLDSFLNHSYLFTRAVSPAPWTVPSFISTFTSMYPSEHKVVNKFVEYDKAKNKIVQSNLQKLTPNAVTLAEVFKQNGYLTAGFTGDAGASAIYGDGQGFDVYYDATTFGGFQTAMPLTIDWLKQNKDKKFFLFVHGYDVHGQYAPSEGYDYRYVQKPYTGEYTGSVKEQAALREAGLAGNLNLSEEDVKFWRAIYDEKINRADEKFGEFMKQLDEMNLDKNTLIVVFSDHGTEFYEHQKFDHGHTLYNELLDVLFAIHLPGQREETKINSLVSTLDIFPTILKLVNLKNPVPAQTKGINISPSFSGKDVSRDIFAETDYRLYTHKRSVETTDGWKFILTMNGLQKELYNLNIDPAEQVNLIDQESKRAYELEQLIYNHLKQMGVNPLGPWPLGCLPVYGDQCQEPVANTK
jgi:arylsulfatase A-like enzyme